MAYANEYLRNFLEGEASPGIEAEYALLGRLLPDIDLTEVEALSTEWMSDSNRVVVVQAPAKDSAVTPAPGQILSTFADVKSRDLAPYEDLVADAPLVRSPPTPGTIESESRDERLGTRDWRLSNGVRVVLRPTDFKNDEVLVRGFSPGGLSLVSDDDYMSGQFATLLVASSGIGEMDATQLQKTLAGKAVQVSPSLSELTESISASASPVDLETMFQLIYLDFTAARRDTAAFASLMSRLHGFLRNQSASPAAAFRDTLSVTLAQHHPRARPISETILDEVRQERALAIYRDRFADASDFTFVVVGAFQPDSIRPLVLRWLGGLPATQRTETWRDVGIESPPDVVEKVVRKGVEPQAQTALVFTGDLDTYDRTAVHGLASAAAVLEIRLREVLREELGGTYDVSVGQTISPFPTPRWGVTIAFGADPERIDSLTDVVFTEIDRLATEGPDAATLEKVQETQRRDHETALRENGYWVSQIAGALLRGETPGAFLDLDALIDALTPEAIARDTRRFLNRDRYVHVTLLPENSGDDSR
jgi:zinc protease